MYFLLLRSQKIVTHEKHKNIVHPISPSPRVIDPKFGGIIYTKRLFRNM
jgi:hypothetical protein